MNALPSPAAPVAAVLRFADDALLRCRGGRWLIHTSTSPLPAFQTDHPRLIGWLSQFMRATLVESALRSMSPADRAQALQVLSYLQRSGALVDAELPSEPLDAEDRHRRTQAHLRTLSRSVYDLTADLNALGPSADQDENGVDVERRVMALLAAVDGLRQQLATRRVAHLRRQLDAQGLTADSRDLDLHIGCGPLHFEGWINIDVHPAPLSINLLWGLPFAEGSVRRIYLSHVLEHLFFPGDVRRFLADVLRVLRPGGTVRIVVPDIELCIDAYRRGEREFFAQRNEQFIGWPQTMTPLAEFLNYAGAGPDPSSLFEAHKYGYDAETLSYVLNEAGFVDVRRCTFMGSTDPALRVDARSRTASAEVQGRHCSLFVEARKAG